MLVAAIITGLVLGGTYALVAMGLTIQYGIARIMNLAYGETIIAAAFAAYVINTGLGANPILGLVVVVPLGFGFGWLVYGFMLHRLVKRSKGGAALEVDSILATFGLLFVIQGVMLVAFGSNYLSYNFMNYGINILGANVAANRLLALVLAVVIGGGLYPLLTYTRWGTALRAVAVAPASAPLVGIDADRAARFAVNRPFNCGTWSSLFGPCRGHGPFRGHGLMMMFGSDASTCGARLFEPQPIERGHRNHRPGGTSQAQVSPAISGQGK